MRLKPAKMEELLWADVKNEVKILDPSLFEIIEEFDPSSEYTLFKAYYPYGTEILNQGILHLPDPAGNIVSIHSDAISDKTRHLLGYNQFSNPVTLVLKNSIELFTLYKETIIPLYGIIPAGKLFGASIILNDSLGDSPIFLWNMTSGARSSFLLQKMSESQGLSRLNKHFNLTISKMNSPLAHWHLFYELSNHHNFGENWCSEVLFFSKPWFDWSNKKLSSFRIALFEKAWHATEFWRNQIIWNLVYSIFQEEKIVRMNPYIADTVKHLIAVGIGAYPAFAPAVSDFAGPFQRLQKILLEFYQIEYAPVIMCPAHISDPNVNAIYYSMEFQTSSEFSPHARQTTTKIADLYDIKEMLKKFFNFMSSAQLNITDTKLFNLKKNISYDFFHSLHEDYSGILPVTNIFIEDESFKIAANAAGSLLPFSKNSSFLKGCIRIRKKNNIPPV